MDPAKPGSPYATPTIRILGPVEIDGPGSCPRGRVGQVAETIVYLALHPHGVDVDELTLALWRGGNVKASTWRVTVSHARRWLHGPDRCPDEVVLVRGGHVTLGATVELDWRRFDALTSRAYGRGHDGVGDLRDALSLVRGPAFFGRPPNRYGWLVDTSFEYDIPAAVDDAANHLASLCLEIGDWSGARDAARRGLRANPDSPRLLRTLLRAECALDNQAQAWVVADTILRDPDALDAETAALIETLPAAGRTTRARSQ